MRGVSLWSRRDPARPWKGHLPHKAFPGKMVLRKGKDGHVFVTDGGHCIIDGHLGRITARLAGLLNAIPGVVEHGLFRWPCQTVILAGAGEFGLWTALTSENQGELE